MDEQAWQAGYNAAMARIANETMRHLDAGNRDKLALLTERQRAIVALRAVCADFGDNDWVEQLQAAIDKRRQWLECELQACVEIAAIKPEVPALAD